MQAPTEASDTRDGPITVLHVRNSNYAGGIETTFVGWFKATDRAQVHPRLLVFRERRGLHERSVEVLARDGVDVEMLPWGHLRNLPGAVRALLRKIREQPRTVLHSHDTRSDLVCLIAARIAKVPFVISNHAWHPADAKRKVLESIRARIMPHADLVISVSEQTHRETLERGVPADRCMALYSGIDLEPYEGPHDRSAARASLGLSEEHRVVGNIARLWPEKEQATLVEAAALLHARDPAYRVVIVGDGPLMEPLRAQIRRLGLEDVVLMPGFRDDFVRVLSALDVFAFPSSAEGTPMVIYSAMAMGVPIVASPVAGVGEVLTDGESALLVPPAKADALAGAIERLVSDPELARRLGERARSDAHEHYSAASAVRELHKVYARLMGSGTATTGGGRDG
jgi:glycosyltransferase involved in cell wall biosynthesis